ncbi:MAG: hypothetical protein PVH61_03880 [Candidatus Aminicenantes bacterium]|jgi:hypothetical protein
MKSFYGSFTGPGKKKDVEKMRKNYKIQNTNYKQITNKKTKGSYGLHQGTFKLQTMTALIKSFCGGVQGGRFLKKAPPLAAGGKE